MDKSIFQQKPSTSTCDCIICRKTGVPASNEHIISLSIGGCVHSWRVCKACNSTFGNSVDIKLVNHYLIQWQRYFHQLKGESKKEVKSPLEGTFRDEDGEPYKVTNEEGKMTPHLLRPSFLMAADGSKVTMTIDPNTPHPEKILEKYCTDNHIPYDATHVSISEVKEAASPKLTIQTSIDLSAFRMGILKIAYEFVAELLPEYLSDTEGQKIAAILKDADYSRIDEVDFCGDGITDVFSQMFKDIIDFSQEKRHYILLTNVAGKMYCIVKLFNVFCLGIKMSDTSYPLADENVILINDFNKHDFDLFTLEELVNQVSQHVGTDFQFMEGVDAHLQQLASTQSIGFYSADDGTNLCFSPSGTLLGSTAQMLQTVPEADIETLQSPVPDAPQAYISTTTYHINAHFCFCLAPTQELMPVKSVICKSKVQKY